VSNEPDMDSPVTRRELHESLETWSGAIISKLTSKLTEEIARSTDEVTMRVIAVLDDRVGKVEARLDERVKGAELYIIGRMEAMLDPHRTVPERVERLEAHSLPERIRKLEAKVFPPKRRATAARRKRS
jgi:hypothetical protein